MKPVSTFLKAYWKHILAVTLSAIYIVKTQYDYAALYKMYHETSEAHKEELNELQDLHFKSTLEKNHAIKEYKDKIKALEEQYKSKSEEIVEQNKETKKKFKEKFNDNPEEIIQDIENTFGFSHVE